MPPHIADTVYRYLGIVTHSKRSVETSQLMASLERLIEKKHKITKIVPFTDEELDWLLSSAT